VEVKSGMPIVLASIIEKLPRSIWLDCDARRLKSM
jgi:hypothetical protein